MKTTNEVKGTLTRQEAIKVAMDLMHELRVPKSIFAMTKSGNLEMLIGSRKVEFEFKAGMTFYGLRKRLADLENAARQANEQRGSRQIDIEDCIAKARQLEATE